MKHRHEANRYEARFDNRMRSEDSKGVAWDSDELDDFASWEIEGQVAAEI